MSIDGFKTEGATLTGIGSGGGTLQLPATATAISIGGDFGQPDQVIAKNKTTNILEWDFVSDLSIPDHSIAGVKLKTDITFSTTGNIGLNNLTLGEGTGSDPHPTITNAQYDGTDATDDITIDPSKIKERFSVVNTAGTQNYLTASSGLGTGGNPIVSIQDAPLRIDYTDSPYSTQIGTATASGILQGANTDFLLNLKNCDFTDSSNSFGDHDFGDCAFGRVIIGGQDAEGNGRSPGQLLLRDRHNNNSNCVITSGNNSGARIQFSNPGTIEVSNVNNDQYDYAIKCHGTLEINSDSGSNGKLKFGDANDTIEGHSSGTATTNLNMFNPSNQVPINYQAYQFVAETDDTTPRGLIEIEASGPATDGGLIYFDPFTYDGDARLVGGNENWVIITIDGKVGQRYFKICIKGNFAWEEENNSDLGIGSFFIRLQTAAGGPVVENSLFRVGMTSRAMRGEDIALNHDHYCEYEFIYDYGADLEEDTTINLYPHFANSFQSNPEGESTTTCDLLILGGYGGGVSGFNHYWYSTTESIPYNPINTPSGEAVDISGFTGVYQEGYPELPE